MSLPLSSGDIKKRRLSLGLSQQELAELTGLSVRTVQRIENGETTPRGYSLRKLAEVLQISAAEPVSGLDKSASLFIMITMHLLALAFLYKPILGVLFPMLIWLIRKDNSPALDQAGRRIINFELTLYLAYLSLFVVVYLLSHTKIIREFNSMQFFYLSYIILQILNLTVVLVNIVGQFFNRSFWYTPVISFLKIPKSSSSIGQV